jgi:hypothetical protein
MCLSVYLSSMYFYITGPLQSISIPIYIFVYICIYLSLSVFIFLSFMSLCLYLSLYIPLSFFVSNHVSLSVSLCVSIPLHSFYAYVYIICIYLFIYLAIYIPLSIFLHLPSLLYFSKFISVSISFDMLSVICTISAQIIYYQCLLWTDLFFQVQYERLALQQSWVKKTLREWIGNISSVLVSSYMLKK